MIYASKVEDLRALESLAAQGLIDLYYGDETQVSSEGYVPYGWQFSDEKVAIYTRKGYKMNIFGLINRNNACSWASTEHSINSEFVMQHLDHLSLQINKQTFVVLDNASIHQSKLMQERGAVWQERGLYLFFYPPTPLIST
jgi:hypothetical protein